MKYIFLLFTLCFYKTNAQTNIAHKQDTLRWFVGHWINKKTFKIDSTIYGKGGGGGTVSVKEDGTFEVSTPEIKELNKKVNTEITDIDKDEETIRSFVKAGEGIYQYNLASKSVKELDGLKEELKNSINTEKNIGKSSSPHPPTAADKMAASCKAFESEYHRIIDFYTAHRKDKNPHFDLPPPPTADYFNCWGCDTVKQKEFDTQCKIYVRDFFKDIAKDASTLIGNMQMMEAMKLVDGTSDNDLGPGVMNLYSKNKNHPGACSYISYTDMSLAYDFYMKWGELMAAQLLRDNNSNYGALKPVIEICLNVLGQKAALAGSDNNLGERMEISELALPLQNFYDTLTTLLFKDHDYRLIRMIPFTVGLLSNIKGLEAYAFDAPENPVHTFKPKYSAEDLLGFPRFELTVELDTKIGEKGSYTIAHLKSKSKVIVELDDKECMKFTLAKKEEEKIKADIITNEAIAPGPHGVYVGTKTYTSQSPIFKIRFCKIDAMPEGDSLYLSTFVPLAPDKGNWNIQGNLAPLGINSADRLFINIDQLKNDAQNIKPDIDQKQLEEIKKKAMDMAAKMNAMKAKGNFDPSKMGEMVKQMMNNTHAIVETKTSELMRIKLPLKVKNMDKMLINQRFDAKEINPSVAQPIVYAYLTIKLEHTPTSGGEAD